MYINKNKNIYIYTLPPPSMEVANGSLEGEFCLQKGFLFPLLWLLGKMYILYEIILIIHLLTKDSDIHSHYLSLLFWDHLHIFIVFPRDSVHGWATETRNNSEYQAPRSRFALFFLRCHWGHATMSMLTGNVASTSPAGKSSAKEMAGLSKSTTIFFDGYFWQERWMEFSYAYVGWSRRVYELFTSQSWSK